MNAAAQKITAEQNRSRVFTIPNLLTLFRIVVTPLFFILFYYFPTKVFSLLASVLFALASLTDFLDGYIARRWNLETSLGKFLDPLADKLLVAVALIMLIPLGRVPSWMVAVIIGREILVTGLRVVAITEGLVIAASKLGKYKTVFQIVSVTCLLLHYEYHLFIESPYLLINFHQVGMGLLWVALVITVWSGIDYFRKFFRQVFFRIA
ncbi:MAG: CDP-diacylglycerol--glycerol-3-phosphate 3-phosphatidyltransferase [Proteobacteria bacterium]|jgi:CDP-diacylglycerol--glycerol-3-phosphate 3-phosphatidyltransferase|nr:CDP-diacylglycerol--glycerol-3-phosphate 3-phosphatidyltransferase [Pseudomonadota bacterium]